MAYPERKAALAKYDLSSFVWFYTHIYQVVAAVATGSVASAMIVEPNGPLHSWPVVLRALIGFGLVLYRLVMWWSIVQLWVYPAVFLWVDAILALFPTIFGGAIVLYAVTAWFGATPWLALRIVMFVLIGVMAANYVRVMQITADAD